MAMFSTPPQRKIISASERESMDTAIQTGTKKILDFHAHSDRPVSSVQNLDVNARVAKSDGGSLKIEMPPPLGPAASTSSNHTKNSELEFIARKKRLELEAAEANARIELELNKKRLAADIAALQVERSQCSSKSARSSIRHKVDEWMQRSHEDVMQPPTSGHHEAPAPTLAAPTDIQQLAHALKDAIATATVGINNRQILSRIGTEKELPLFYGDPIEWLTFKRTYTESTNLCKFSETENVCRLRNCLRGEAKETVSALLIGNTSSGSIMETLELRYGRPEIIIQKITAQLRKLPPLSTAYHNEIVNFSIKVKNYVAAARAIQQTDYLRSPELMSAVITKCPTALITKWADYTYTHQHEAKPKLELFSDFLFDEATKTSMAGVSHVYTFKKPEERKVQDNRHVILAQPQSSSRSIAVDTKSTERKCLFCHGSYHALPTCTKFKKAMRKDRWRFIRGRNLCHKCLIDRHKSDECPAPNCEIDQCGLPHHALLHWPAPASSTPSAPPDQVANISEDNSADPECDHTNDIHGESVNNTISVSNSIVMLKIVPVVLRGPKGEITTSALLDDGATVSLIASDIADSLGLKGQKKQLRMRGAWENNEIVCTSETVSCSISGFNSNNLFELHAQKIKELNLPEQNMLKVNISKYKHLSNIIPNCIKNVNYKPKVLIGQDNYDLIKPLQLLTGSKNEPFGTLTPLGWCVHGLMSTLSSRYSPSDNRFGGNAHTANCAHDLTRTVTHVSSYMSSCDDIAARPVNDCGLSELVRKSFALDALGISAAPPRQNRLEVRAIETLKSTAQLVNGHWEVGLPWKSDAKMPDSLPTALSRLKSIERKMSRDPGFEQRYKERIQHLFTNNYAREVKQGESGPRVWYLPHFGVDNPNKKKLRLVFDAAATTNGFCLNDYLLQGPDLLESLLGIMLRFRENKIGISADIRDMFLRVKIRPEDQHAFRFLWRSADGQIKHFAMTSLIFGANCSPFIAQFVKNLNAERFKQTLPDPVSSIITNHYCDDYVDSFTTAEAAIKSMKEITYVHAQGGFHITNWTSNDASVCDVAPKETLSPACIRLNFDEGESFERTLGLLWYPLADCLGFNLSFKNVDEDILNGKQKPTKRELLRIVMTIYDIYGFLAPFTMKAKILLQSTWKKGITWDQVLTDDMFVVFKEWIGQIKFVNNLRIPRWYFIDNNDNSQCLCKLDLHLFCDASPTAYNAVAYWRSYSDDDKVDFCVSFAMSKSRLAPVKATSIPRLELQAGVLACRLADTLKKEHRLSINQTFYWTDSTTVLLWIRNDHRNYNTFVANRLGEIDNLSSAMEWHYVPSELNIADVATKNNNYRLTNDCEWFKGPSFLRLPADQWPREPVNMQNVSREQLEIKTINTVISNNNNNSDLPVPDPTRFSSWLRLLRTTATVLLFVEKCRLSSISTISNTLMERAELLLLRFSQEQSFKSELNVLRQNKYIDRHSRLRTLTPILGSDGLLRVGGRIDATNGVSAQVKRPVILDGRDHIARLIVKHYHERAAHASNEMVVNELRQRYWLLRLRPTVRTVASHCLFCRIRKVTPQPPRLGDLPDARLSHHQRPFTHCGIDLFGPMEVTVGRRRDKRYGVLFTCLTVRAVHVEIVHSLTTDSLIMALRRMAARRGWPAKIYSDNGTNLRGAEVELKKSYNELNHEYLLEYATNYGVDWHFISPASPHMGGAWERLIRSIKTALKVVLRERAPRDETLSTLLAEVEAMVNSRPLSHVSVDHDAHEALTPNHFLIGSSSGLPVPGEFCEGDLYLRRQWRVAQRLADLFWSRWMKEILPSLLPRSKWTEDNEPLREGDFVYIVDPSSPRNCWPKGRIVQTHPGRDGRVRVVDVQTRTAIYRRPAARVARLPQVDECRRDDTRGRM